MQQHDSLLAFDFNAVAAYLRRDFPFVAKNTVLLDVTQRSVTTCGPQIETVTRPWLQKRIADCQKRRASFFDIYDGQKFCFIYTGTDRRIILGEIENLHLTVAHEFGHALDPDLTKSSYSHSPHKHEKIADIFALLYGIKNETLDQHDIDISIRRRELSFAPYDTSDHLRHAFAWAQDKKLQIFSGAQILRQAQRISKIKL